MEKLNTRVLIIDDEEMVRDNIEEILIPQRKEKNKKVDDALDLLFDEEEKPEKPVVDNKQFPDFRVDKAYNGQIGLEKVSEAVENGDPYAVIFLDMRMPGWDGLETAKRIRLVDGKVEIIIVTAYSDHSIDQIVKEAGRNVGYHVKPYNSEEILQLATKAVNDYNKLRNLEDLIATTGRITIGETQLNSLLQNIFDQLARYIGTENAVMGMMREEEELDLLFEVGNVEDSLNREALLKMIRVARHNSESIVQNDNVVLALLQDYPVFALLKPNETLKTEKIYLLQLFIQNATHAIQNAHLQEELLRKEKLSAAGNALGMLMHDLRTPIKNIPQITDMLRADGANEELLGLLDQSSRQASEILDDFLDFVREAPIKKEKVLLDNLIKEAIKLTNNRRDLSKIHFDLQEKEAVYLQGDASKIKRMIMNILSNAGDALLDFNIPNPTIKIECSNDGNFHRITIRDNGPGIPPTVLSKIFQPFTTEGKADGTGLGLTIVKQYVDAHGGNIHAFNDNGAVFDIRLPLWKD
ncbi:hybrid sensor histidine kinase/response regulator [Croceimicrobium hydrocarbonivorans]|uniref:histidine kinase n=1 Tax=Croceimicrobium hydrocarbonivorans TaxID=2761580 RepID=A0A7H0VF76_9FLAO|nr:hybrid sensor histidine kinase/response regulator [Croceimicrobium hydrocarbonivorans]QNR24374.1 hybrid sensor histidine kinase/response regulator [Croceimicrobium hydrocarbonivorans]